MASNVVKSFFSLLLVLFCFIREGEAATTCSLSDITVTQRTTGASVEGQAEYKVTVSNNCSCPQSKVIVRCFGLSSVEPVDPSAIKPIGNGDNCSVAGGRQLKQGAPVMFKYAWKTPQDFPLVSSQIHC